jgi:hypothetical protein
VLSDDEIERLGESVLREAKMRPTEPADALKLARRIVGPVMRLESNGLPSEVMLCCVHGQHRVYVRGEVSPLRLAWSLVHETAEFVLRRLDYREPDVEDVANRLAAALRAPQRFAEQACRARGPRWTQLALDFGSSESCAALRYGEVMGAPLALLTATKLARYRGNWFGECPSEEKLRSRQPGPRIVKARLRDDPSRFVARSLS